MVVTLPRALRERHTSVHSCRGHCLALETGFWRRPGHSCALGLDSFNHRFQRIRRLHFRITLIFLRLALVFLFAVCTEHAHSVVIRSVDADGFLDVVIGGDAKPCFVQGDPLTTHRTRGAPLHPIPNLQSQLCFSQTESRQESRMGEVTMIRSGFVKHFQEPPSETLVRVLDPRSHRKDKPKAVSCPLAL